MKKLKVILPAILTLAVSTSAAVTGTVAWFTASRLQTVKMTGITAVNPESGLNLNNVENVANTKVDFDDEGTPNKYTITHGKVLKQNGVASNPADWNTVYLRDASVNMKTATPTVWAADVNETGSIDGYEDQVAPFNDKDGKTFNENGVVYATAFTLNFSPTTLDSGFNYSLFLDIKTSSVTVDNGANPEANANLNKALRLGFKQGNSFFVWAPFALSSEAKTEAIQGAESKTNYRVNYVIDENEDDIEYYNDTNATKILIGNAAANSGDPAPVENQQTGIYAKQQDETNAGDKYIGYLGILNQLYDANDLQNKPGTNVQVYTWFEGTDPNCVADEFGGSLDNITSTLNFVMRRTEKNA